MKFLPNMNKVMAAVSIMVLTYESSNPAYAGSAYSNARADFYVYENRAPADAGGYANIDYVKEQDEWDVTLQAQNLLPYTQYYLSVGTAGTSVGDTVMTTFTTDVNGNASWLGAVNNLPLQYNIVRIYRFFLSTELTAPEIDGSLKFANDRDGDGVDDDDDLFPDDPKRATIIDHINCIIVNVSDDAVIFDSDWQNKKMRNAYLNKLEVILELVTAAEAAEDPEAAALIYAEALDKVNNDLIKKTDGLQGVGASKKNDWLKVQEAQDIVYPDLLFLSEYLLEKTL